MRQFKLQHQETEQEFEDRQTKEWLSESHYWVEKNGTYYCKWCGRFTTTSLDGDAALCEKNPLLKK